MNGFSCKQVQNLSRWDKANTGTLEKSNKNLQNTGKQNLYVVTELKHFTQNESNYSKLNDYLVSPTLSIVIGISI